MPQHGAPLLRVRGLTRRFGGHAVFTGLDLEVRGGTAVALVGRNGAGKSTVLRCVTGADTADEGSVVLPGVLAEVELVRQSDQLPVCSPSPAGPSPWAGGRRPGTGGPGPGPPALSGALAVLDPALVCDVLLARRWRSRSRVRAVRRLPRRLRTGLGAVVARDLVRIRRSPRPL